MLMEYTCQLGVCRAVIVWTQIKSDLTVRAWNKTPVAVYAETGNPECSKSVETIPPCETNLDQSKAAAKPDNRNKTTLPVYVQAQALQYTL